MLSETVASYLAVRRACGFELKSPGNLLRSFATFSDARGKHHVCSEMAIEWAGLAKSVYQRARRPGEVIQFARYVRAEDQSHDLPPAVFGREKGPRPIPYIFSQDDIKRLVHAATQSGYRSLRRQTYSTLFALLACTGLRVSEAIRLDKRPQYQQLHTPALPHAQTPDGHPPDTLPTKNYAHSMHADLQEVMEAWPQLSDEVKGRIVALCRMQGKRTA